MGYDGSILVQIWVLYQLKRIVYGLREVLVKRSLEEQCFHFGNSSSIKPAETSEPQISQRNWKTKGHRERGIR